MENIRYFFGGLKLSERDKTYVEAKIEKCGRLLSNYKESELRGEVELGQDKKGFWRIEVMIKTPHELYRVSKQDGDLFKAVDVLEEALMKQIRRNKEKIRGLSRKKRKLEDTAI